MLLHSAETGPVMSQAGKNSCFFSYLIKAAVLFLESCKQKKGRDNQTVCTEFFWRMNQIKSWSGGDAETCHRAEFFQEFVH